MVKMNNVRAFIIPYMYKLVLYMFLITQMKRCDNNFLSILQLCVIFEYAKCSTNFFITIFEVE